ncbi:MAG: alkaline phosphatase PhoX, partial [Pseudomonadota bacterium]
MTEDQDAFDAGENSPVNPRARSARTLGDLISERMSRRSVLRGAAGAAVAVATPAALAGCGGAQEAAETPERFEEITRGTDGRHHVPPGYRGDVVIRWGDPIFPDAPAFDPDAQTAAAQERQFGFNNDYIGFLPLSEATGDRPARALLCVNHEFTRANMMFPGVSANYPASLTAAHCDVEKAAHGGTVLEVALVEDRWRPVLNSKYNRRITATTPTELTGPAAGDDRLKTSTDPEGRKVLGTLNNCAGGITPWKTYLLAEENFNGNFGGALTPGHPETPVHERYGVPAGWYQWHRFEERFDVGKEPNEANRFGWVVEVDPLDPASTPKKRTAMGRFKHEGAESVIAPDGRVVFYMGDDQRFEYVYKFVTNGLFDPQGDNSDLLDDGVLYVARFDADGGLACPGCTSLPLFGFVITGFAPNVFCSLDEVVEM